jgi:hypothetical protein
MARRRIRYDEATMANVTVEIASRAEDLEAAARLVHNACVDKKLIDADSSGLRITPHLLLPSTLTVIARHTGEGVIGTVSLFADSALGFPMENIYPDEVRGLRGSGRRLVEVGAFALTPGHRHSGVALLLYKMVIQLATVVSNADDLVVAIHPTAAAFYRGWLLFEDIGPVRRYPRRERSALAVALRLDLTARYLRHLAAFGHQPAGVANPLHFHYRRSTPAIRMPEPGFLNTSLTERLQSAAALMKTYGRRRFLASIDPREAEHLVRALEVPPARPDRRPPPAASPALVYEAARVWEGGGVFTVL